MAATAKGTAGAAATSAATTVAYTGFGGSGAAATTAASSGDGSSAAPRLIVDFGELYGLVAVAAGVFAGVHIHALGVLESSTPNGWLRELLGRSSLA